MRGKLSDRAIRSAARSSLASVRWRCPGARLRPGDGSDSEQAIPRVSGREQSAGHSSAEGTRAPRFGSRSNFDPPPPAPGPTLCRRGGSPLIDYLSSCIFKLMAAEITSFPSPSVTVFCRSCAASTTIPLDGRDVGAELQKRGWRIEGGKFELKFGEKVDPTFCSGCKATN